jgi:hypothetical protein
VPIPSGAVIGDDTDPGWLSRFGESYAAQTSPISMVQGLAQAGAHPIETVRAVLGAQGDLADKAEDAFKKGNYVEGLQHAINYLIPVLGPQLDVAGNQLRAGNIAGGLGTTAGIATNLALPELVGAAGRLAPSGLAESMYTRSLKPSTTVSLAERQAAVQTALENAIPISKSGAEKLEGLIGDLNQKITAELAAGPNVPSISPLAATAKLPQVARKFPFAPDLAQVTATGQQLVEQFTPQGATAPTMMTPVQAQEMKVGLRRPVSFGEMGPPVAEARKAMARGLKEELETQFPEIANPNAEESKLLDLQPLLDRAVNRISNRDLLSLGGKIVGTGIGAAAGAAGGGVFGGAGGAAAALILHHVLTDPEIQSNLAIGLSRMGKIPVSEATARVAGYTNQLGNAISNAAESSNQPTIAPGTLQ